MSTIPEANTSSEAIRSRDRRHVWHPWSPLTIDRSALTAVRGDGYRIWDVDGRQYIDGTGGALSLTCGYSHPRLVTAMSEQAGHLHHFDLSIASHELAGRLAERIAGLLPDPLDRVLFVNSGSEGIEAAVLMTTGYWAHQGTPRKRFVSLTDGYHGSTVVCKSLSGLPRVAHGFAPPVPVSHVDLPFPAREMRSPAALDCLIAALDRAIGDDPADRPAAVVVEPFLNVGGGIELPAGSLRAIRQLCDERHTLLVLDEVFTAYGRCGAMFACLREGVTPDVIVSSKGLASGYVPISAVVATNAIYETFRQDPAIGGLRYGHTMSGHALGCVAALTTIDIIEDEGLAARAEDLGSRLRARLERLVGPALVDVRGMGLIVAMELASQDAADEVLAAAREAGVLLRPHGPVLMVVPALTIDEAGIDAVADAVERALAAVRAN